MVNSEKSSVMQSWLLRALLIMLLDIVVIGVAFFSAFLLRFDFQFSLVLSNYLDAYLLVVPITSIAAIAVFWIFRLYHSIWSYASINELIRMIGAWIVLGLGGLVFIIIDETAHSGGRSVPASVWIMGLFFAAMGTTAVRFVYRLMRHISNAHSSIGKAKGIRNVMIIGGGACGKDVIREYKASENLTSKVCCIIDDNAEKKGRFLEGIEIVGNRYDIPKMVGKYDIDDIVFAIPAASGSERKEILDICSNTGCKVRVMPGIYQLVDGTVSLKKTRDVQIEDLLGRDTVKTNMEGIRSYINGKVVMVTGGGGSIGSELCRQIAKAEPKLLIIFDIYENNAFWIEKELRDTFGEKLNLIALIGSVRNTNRVNSIMKTYHPDIIFHAAAHKHVPLMEDSPNEAIKNNVGGTYKMAEAALRWGVQRFVLISTDKAVNPTNIMGASKRICEMVVQMMDRRAQKQFDAGEVKVRTNFSAVRFGNVIGSNGSVLKVFEKQIAAGGPVTVTDKNIIRYFMTIPEAVALVMESGVYARGGEIFVLDMGDPVKIDDVARKMIKLSGYVPDVDIKVEYTGLRPGEKMYEERLMDEEGLRKTEENPEISIAEPIEMDDELVAQKLVELDEAAKEEVDNIRELVAEIVPTYKPVKN
ncbi:MAG: polysaccharide biosynthesis protein [Clostridiales bacterium]|nr:polysaccharide biosynthesis protein [Clostridiales bacterium]